MSFRINTNISALNAHTIGVANNRSLHSSLEKLSSGLRLNKAADDASGMAIADSLRSQSEGLGQAVRNANDAIGIIQVADKAMDEQLKILDTIKTKAIQAAQDGQTTETRKETMIEKETVKSLVNQWLEGKEYFLTDLSVSTDNRIVVEIDHKEGVWIDDCVNLSRYIDQHLDREVEDYELEVGSAGIGQPFKVLQQYVNHVGKQVEVVTTTGEKLRGLLKEANEEGITLTLTVKVKEEGMKRPKLQEQERQLSFNDIKQTQYVIDYK